MTLPNLPSDTRIGISNDVAELLARVDAEIAAFQPKCDASGRCCHFEEYGHRLYITLAELIHFSLVMTKEWEIQSLAPSQKCAEKPRSTGGISLPQFFASAQPKGCPYQKNNLCHARTARPIGCRIYFCDPNAQSWQNTLYEKYHHELKAIHLRWDVEYAYMEWRTSLSLALENGWLPTSP